MHDDEQTEITGEDFLRELQDLRDRAVVLQQRLLAKGPISADWVSATIWLTAVLQLLETQAQCSAPDGSSTFFRAERDTEPPSPPSELPS